MDEANCESRNGYDVILGGRLELRSEWQGWTLEESCAHAEAGALRYSTLTTRWTRADSIVADTPTCEYIFLFLLLRTS
jgi:hypothetical protein